MDEIQTLLDGNQEILEKINEGTAAVRQRKDEGIAILADVMKMEHGVEIRAYLHKMLEGSDASAGV